MDRRWLAVACLVLALAAGCTQPKPPAKVWVDLEPVQCQGNPWEHLDQKYAHEIDAIKAYYSSNGVEIYDSQYIERTVNACLACACPRGDKYRLLVDAGNEERLAYWPQQPGTGRAFFEVQVQPERVDSGSELKVLVRNNATKPAYFGGCNDYSVESLADGAWKELGWLARNCFWEGLPREVAGQGTLELIASDIDVPGRHRLKFVFGMDCVAGKPLSQAECQLMVPVYSNEFEVNPLAEVPAQQLRSCGNASECVTVTDGCCDCFAGGKNTAINRKFASYWAKKQAGECLAVACPAGASQDPTCADDFRPDCVEGACQLVKHVVAGPAEAPRQPAFKGLASGPFSLGSNVIEVVDNAQDWITLWENMHAQLKPVPSMPAVDFNKSMVVGVFMGRQDRDYFLVSVEKVEETDTEFIVYYSTRVPGAVEVRNTGNFAPYAVIEVPRTKKAVVVKELPAEKT